MVIKHGLTGWFDNLTAVNTLDLEDDPGEMLGNQRLGKLLHETHAEAVVTFNIRIINRCLMRKLWVVWIS